MLHGGHVVILALISMVLSLYVIHGHFSKVLINGKKPPIFKSSNPFYIAFKYNGIDLNCAVTAIDSDDRSYSNCIMCGNTRNAWDKFITTAAYEIDRCEFSKTKNHKKR